MPFDEPDLIRYGGNPPGFLDHWKPAYRGIRSTGPEARIAGPDLASCRPADMRAFMTYARDNGVLPSTVGRFPG